MQTNIEILYLTWCFTQVSECSDHEDEYDCDWHKRSPIQEIENFEQFQKYYPSIHDPIHWQHFMQDYELTQPKIQRRYLLFMFIWQML